MHFIDKTQIVIRSGRGGSGQMSFKRARNLPNLGPDGGNGGWGGHVVLRAKTGLNTLGTLRYKQLFRAEDGERGGSNGRTGADGEDRIIEVPLGTIAFDDDTGEQLGELIKPGQQLVVAEGGKRGFGNKRFVSATRQAPDFSTPGGPPVERNLRLELKLLADVGLAGKPNAGKSTLLRRISSARPAVGDYPFTTLKPVLGVVSLGKFANYFGESFVTADIPGLIEGAAEGKGLGHDFLRHLERTSVILYVIDLFSPDSEHFAEDQDAFSPEQLNTKLQTELDMLDRELSSYKHDLGQRPTLVALNKTDLAPHDLDWAPLEHTLQLRGLAYFKISGAAGTGLDEMISFIGDCLRVQRDQEEDDKQTAPESSASPNAGVEQPPGETTQPEQEGYHKKGRRLKRYRPQANQKVKVVGSSTP